MSIADKEHSVVVRFPPARDAFDDDDEQESYQLLELPAEILKAIESGEHDALPLTIKGRPTDDAVLCTPSSTYQIRTITVSNSFVVLRAPTDGHDNAGAGPSTLEIRDTCKEVLECTLIAPRLERIRKVLHDSRWEGLGDDERPAKRKRYTRAQLESTVQASSEQLEAGLKQRNVIVVDDKLLYLAPTDLYPLLSMMLSLLSVHHTAKSVKDGTASAPCEPILQSLEDDHGVSRDVAEGVMSLYGSIDDEEGEKWESDTRRIVREIGIGLLHALRQKQVSSDTFLNDWREQAGDTWDELVDLKSLEGNYLLTPVPISFTTTAAAPLISALFVHTLSTDPATRFGDLFLTRPKWRPDDMKPFLKGLTPDGDQKGLDKMIVKFVRVVKESGKDGGGVWWHPRRSV